jgi:hypothetical protein
MSLSWIFYIGVASVNACAEADKQNAGPQTGVSEYWLRSNLVVAAVPAIIPAVPAIIPAVASIIAAVPTVVTSVVTAVPAVVAAVLSADVMAVNPTTSGPVARDPNHFIVARPIAWAMPVVGPVAYLDADALGLNSTKRKKNAGPKKSDEQKFVFNHTPFNRIGRANCVLYGRRIILNGNRLAS